MTSYLEFLAKKAQLANAGGFEPVDLPDHLFDYQRQLVEWAVRQGRAALFADCGLGKSPMALAWAEQVHLHTGKPVLFLTPLAVGFQIVAEATKFGHDAAMSRDGSIPAPITITNYEQLGKFDHERFGGVVCDECFAAGTLVDTPHGPTPIEDLNIGDQVDCAIGTSPVWDIHRREVPYAIAIKSRDRQVICSPNHPWFTQRGWVCAQDLEPGDSLVDQTEAVRMVRTDVRQEIRDSAPDRAFLRAVLLSEMAYATTGTPSEGPQSRGRRQARRKSVGVAAVGISGRRTGTRTHPESESDVRSNRTRQGFTPIESHEPSTFRAWGKWSGHDGTASDAEGNTWRLVAGGAFCVTGQVDSRLSHALQARLGERRSESRYRTGWSLPLLPEGVGPQERRETGFARVDGIEVLEPTDPRLDGSRDSDGRLYFYDLGVEGHPSYSVNGHLVHNSSILKSFEGATKAAITEFMRRVQYRLLDTATAAPNDYTELGTSSEALGGLGYMDMLTRFFINKDKKVSSRGGRVMRWEMSDRAGMERPGEWRLKGPAEEPFWRWVASWARAIRKPSDYGYSDEHHHLPELIERTHMVDPNRAADGHLFDTPATRFHEEREEQRRTITERCEAAANALSDADTGVAWCHLNDESALLARLIPGAVELSGSDPVEAKEEKLAGFSTGAIKFLVTKPKLGAWGLNWQHAHRMTYFPSHSYEQRYQAIRRMWRFGQAQPVIVDTITTPGGKRVLANLRRKSAQADDMFASLVAHMNNALHLDRTDLYTQPMEMPPWALPTSL